MIGTKVSGALLLANAVCLFAGSQPFYAVLSLIGLAAVCWVVYNREGLTRRRFFADVAVFEITLEDLEEMERQRGLPAQKP